MLPKITPLYQSVGFQFDQIRAVQALCPLTVNVIITHDESSIDDAVGLADLKFHGEKMFPGIIDAEIQICGHEELETILEPYDGDFIRLLVEAKTLVLGMGGSFLDEHNHSRNNYFRPEGECAASLTAKLTGMENDRFWLSIVRYALADDIGEREDFTYLLDARLTLPNMMKAAYAADSENINWVVSDSVNLVEIYFQALEAGLIKDDGRPDWSVSTLTNLVKADWTKAAKKRFFEAHDQVRRQRKIVTEELEKITKFGLIRTYSGSDVNVAIAHHDFPQSHDIIFKKTDAAIVVMRRTTDRVQIFCRREEKINLINVVGLLRQMELKAMGQPIPVGVDFYQTAKIQESSKWFIFEVKNGTHMIFNGSSTAKDTDPTVLTDEQIILALKSGLGRRPVAPQSNTINEVASATPTPIPAAVMQAQHTDSNFARA